MFDLIIDQISQVTLHAPSMSVLCSLVGVCVLLLLSGFASGSEIAFFSLAPKELSELNPEHSSRDKSIQMLRDDSERTLATILITNNFVNVTIIMLCNYIFARVVDFGEAYWLQFLCITVLLTFLLLLFGEIIPKIYSAQHALAFCRFAAPKLQVLNKIFWPLSKLLIRSKVITKRFANHETEMLTVDDLEKAMELTDKKDIAEESNMLKGIIRFGGEMAKEIMTSRVDIVDLDIKASFRDVLECIVAWASLKASAGKRSSVLLTLCLRQR